jgi:hypothetical protein
LTGSAEITKLPSLVAAAVVFVPAVFATLNQAAMIVA